MWKRTTSPWRISTLCFFGDFLDLLDVEGGAFLDDVGAVMRRHVEQHAARHHRRDFFDAELLQPGGIGEVEQLVAVVIDVLDADMAEAIELAADADPAFDDVVVIGGLARSEAGNAGLAGLHDGDLESARRIGGGRGVDGNAERIGLAGLDQACGLHHQFRRHVIGGADLVVRAPFRFCPVLSACRSDRTQQGNRTAPYERCAHRRSSQIDVMVFGS